MLERRAHRSRTEKPGSLKPTSWKTKNRGKGSPAFIGHTQKADDQVANDLNLKPTRISSMIEYEKYFGLPQSEENIDVTIFETQVGGVTTEMKAIASVTESARSKHIMYDASPVDSGWSW